MGTLPQSLMDQAFTFGWRPFSSPLRDDQPALLPSVFNFGAADGIARKHVIITVSVRLNQQGDEKPAAQRWNARHKFDAVILEVVSKIVWARNDAAHMRQTFWEIFRVAFGGVPLRS